MIKIEEFFFILKHTRITDPIFPSSLIFDVIVFFFMLSRNCETTISWTVFQLICNKECFSNMYWKLSFFTGVPNQCFKEDFYNFLFERSKHKDKKLKNQKFIGKILKSVKIANKMYLNFCWVIDSNLELSRTFENMQIIPK